MSVRAEPRQRGFTLVELLMGITIAMIFSAGLYAFFFSGTDAARSRESMGRAQADLRTAIERIERDVRQGVSADGGLNGPVTQLTSTSLIVHTDPTRSPTALTPRPQRVRFSVSGTDLVRERALPVGTQPPFSYGPYSAPEVLARGVTMGSTALFTGFTQAGDQLGTPVSQPRDVAMVRVTLIVAQSTGVNPTKVELSTDVTLRNTIAY